MKKAVIIILLSCLNLIVCNAETNENNIRSIKLTEQMFLELINNYENNDEWKYLGEKPCIIDFYANWCGPCKTIAPILEEIAAEYNEKLIVYKIDVDTEKELVKEFNIKSIPTLMFCPMEGKPEIIIGSMSKSNLKETIKKYLKVEL